MMRIAKNIVVIPILFFIVPWIYENETADFQGAIKTQEEIDELDTLPGLVLHKLLHGEKELQDWADELDAASPQTPQDVWTTFLVSCRAGRDDTACRMLALMKNMPLDDQQLSSRFAGMVFHSTPRNPARWKVLKSFYEAFGAFHAPLYPSEIAPVLQGMQEENRSQGQICLWLKERWDSAWGQPAQRFFLPWGDSIFLLFPVSQVAQRWLGFYFGQLQQAGLADDVAVQFASKARENPDDPGKLALFLYALKYCRPSHLEVDWIHDNRDQYSAVQLWIIGRSMVNVQDAVKHCEILLRHALEKELDDEDCKQFQEILQTRTSMMLPHRENELVQAIFRVEVMDDLNRMYLAQDRNEEAQKIMLAARGLRKEYHLPEGSLLAGTTQMASGQRIVEAEIRAREEMDATEPAYWMERAAYFQGREEWQEQENALRKALSLYDPPELREKGPMPGYRNVLGSLQMFLRQADRQGDAAELFFQQHAIVKDEPLCLWALYYDFGNLPATVGREDEYHQLLREDISKAVNQYIAAAELGDSKDIQEFLSRLDLIRYSPELAISMSLFDFENNPHAWDILKVQNTLTRDKILRLLLFTPDERKKTPEHDRLLKLFLTALEQEKLPVEYYYAIGEVIRLNATLQRNPDNYPAAMMFFEKALQNIDRFPDNHPKYSICTELAWCSLELGDWRNGEKYTVESFENRGLQERELVEWLGRAHDVAEKSGEKDESERIRRRIANLGLTN